MTERSTSLLNRLEKDLPEGLVVDAAWLQERGIASNLRAYYVKAGWLEQPVRSVYKRPR
ncbi:AbiEi antitoxin N-terminal domain-containing protein, partial [Rhizobium nepotum]|uniref:AbiEi antitoxin N-terminal domain-containing protein n=1 Tax=Rhizobium nepotum TaxID=1035271 RepID=UPI000AC7C105